MDDLRAVADRIADLRPEWELPGIVYTLGRIADRPEYTGSDDVKVFAGVAIAIASNPKCNTPNGLAAAGWWNETADRRMGLPADECAHGTIPARCALCRVADQNRNPAASDLRSRLRAQREQLRGQ